MAPSASTGLRLGRLERVVVVGGSLAGLRACETLRNEGYTGTIVLVGAEVHQPYDRPPLSKKFLAGEWDPNSGSRCVFQRRLLRRARPRRPASGCRRPGSIQLPERRVVLADGTEVAYDGLIIATVCRGPRPLPGTSGSPARARAAHARSRGEAPRRPIVAPGRRLVVIGAGFIGLEVAGDPARARPGRRSRRTRSGAGAAHPRSRGRPRHRGRSATPPRRRGGGGALWRERGGPIEAGGVPRTLGDGEMVPADAVLVAIGVDPVTDWLAGSGLEPAQRRRHRCRPWPPGRPGVYAAGDLARWTHPRFRRGDEDRALDERGRAGDAGRPEPLGARRAPGPLLVASDTVPFVWSDQYRHRIQFLGRSTDTEGGPAEWQVLPLGDHPTSDASSRCYPRGRTRAGRARRGRPPPPHAVPGPSSERVLLADAAALAAEQRTARTPPGRRRAERRCLVSTPAVWRRGATCRRWPPPWSAGRGRRPPRGVGHRPRLVRRARRPPALAGGRARPVGAGRRAAAGPRRAEPAASTGSRRRVGCPAPPAGDDSADQRSVTVELTRRGRQLWREMGVTYRRAVQRPLRLALVGRPDRGVAGAARPPSTPGAQDPV